MNNPAMVEVPEYLTYAEVAAICKVTKQTVYNWVKNEEIETMRWGKDGKTVRIPAQALQMKQNV